MASNRKGTLIISFEITSEGYDILNDNSQLINAINHGIQAHLNEKEYTSKNEIKIKTIEVGMLSFATIYRLG